KRWNGMRRKFGAVTAAAVAVIVLRAGAQEAVPPTAEALAAISERGQLLYEYDQAAWHATDAVQMANPKTVEGQHCIARKVNGRCIRPSRKSPCDPGRESPPDSIPTF